jgi:hypothetical protein
MLTTYTVGVLAYMWVEIHILDDIDGPQGNKLAHSNTLKFSKAGYFLNRKEQPILYTYYLL